jgi:putative ABC transport system permease protein
MDWKPRIRETCSIDGRPLDEDVLEELSQHAAGAYETARADGRSHEEAECDVGRLLAEWRRAAPALKRRPQRPTVTEPGGADGHLFAGVVQDARHGLRLLRREPAFALVAILTIALGIGSTTTLFTVVNGVLLKPLPWAHADRLVRISETRQGRTGRVRGTILNGTYLAWADHPTTIDAIGGWLANSPMTLSGRGDPERLKITPVTPSLFPMLAARPLLGRLFASDEGVRGTSEAILLSYGLWQSRFGGSPDVVGQTVQLDDRQFTIVGVMPQDFAFPTREARAWTAWAVPQLLNPGGMITGSIFSAMARLKPGVTIPQATQEGTARARAAPSAGMVGMALFGANGPIDVAVAPARDALIAEVKPAIIVLLVAVLLLLATATANVASLQLARTTTRRRELATRAAIGAGAGRLTRQLLVESAILGFAGGLAGLAVAIAGHRALPSILPTDFPRLDDVALDARVVAAAAALSIVTSMVCGLLPALQAMRVNLVETLADGGGAVAGIGLRSRTSRIRASIMVGQIAIACVMLVSAMLLGRSFIALLHVDRGYDPVNLLTTQIPLPQSYPVEKRLALPESLVERLQSLPGVTHAAASNSLPFLSMGGFSAFNMPSLKTPGAQVEVQALQRIVTPGYFDVLRIRVVNGRALNDRDTATSQPVVVVNRSFATTYLGEPAVGARIPAPKGGAGFFRLQGQTASWEVVGVVEDVRQDSVDGPRQPEIFAAFGQVLQASLRSFNPILVVRTTSDPAALAPALRRIVREAEPTVALDSVLTLEDRMLTNLAKPRLYAVVLVVFGACAIVIAGVGLFGVLAYNVAQRGREIGVRSALGARPADIVLLVVRQAGVIALAATTIGLWLAYASARWLSAFLFGVEPHDPVSFVLVGAVVIAISAIACIVPARRAARVDPLSVLRSG